MSITIQKTVCIIELGGTISCVANDPKSEFYHAEHLSISNLIDQISIESNIKIEIKNLFRVISHEISIKNLIDIGKLIQQLLDYKKYDGFVITMGTNALEDVAYFIDLVIDTNIPIVITGSHYPQNSLFFDGAKNLYNAIRIASSADAINLGVLVTFGDYVVSGRDAIKTTPGLQTNFINQNAGSIGYIIGGQFILRTKPIRSRPKLNNFNLENLNPSLKIAIIYGHLGMDDILIKAAIESRIHGIVSAGFGTGYQPISITKSLRKAVSLGVTVVRCPRANFGYSSIDPKYDLENGFILANGLTPNKVVILLFVALSFTNNYAKLNEIFGALK